MQHGEHGEQVVKGRARGEGVVVEGAAGAAWGAWGAGSVQGRARGEGVLGPLFEQRRHIVLMQQHPAV